MREFVWLNSERESRDELGIGAIRDTLSDALFPGSSTLHTRARYLLLIPWAFQAGGARATAAVQSLPQIEGFERRMIDAFRKASETEGLIGADVGARVKNLPSRLYWAALSRYGILRDSRISRASAAELTFLDRKRSEGPEAISPWLPTLPPVPADFPKAHRTAFGLDHTEAELLQEQIIRSTHGSLLAHLLQLGHRPEGSFAPWEEPSAYMANETVRALLRNARLFSLAINGATLLYALLLAEEYKRLGYTGLDNPVDAKREALDEWESERHRSQAELEQWNLDDLWNTIRTVQRDPAHPQRTIGPSTQRFVTDWTGLLRDDTPVADSARHRDIIRQRETRHKGKGSRLNNSRLLQMWQ